MLRNLIAFYNLARDAVQTTAKSRKKITWNFIRTNFESLIYELLSMKFKVNFICGNQELNKVSSGSNEG